MNYGIPMTNTLVSADGLDTQEEASYVRPPVLCTQKRRAYTRGEEPRMPLLSPFCNPYL